MLLSMDMLEGKEREAVVMCVSHEDREAQLVPPASHTAVHTPMLFAPHARRSHAPMRIR